MAEPSSSGVVAGSISSGIVGALAALGVPWPLLAWGIIGSIVGLSWAPESGRMRAFFLFTCASLCAAKFGLALSAWAFNSHADIAGALACGLGIVMHPLLSAVVESIPTYIASRAKK